MFFFLKLFLHFAGLFTILFSLCYSTLRIWRSFFSPAPLIFLRENTANFCSKTFFSKKLLEYTSKYIQFFSLQILLKISQLMPTIISCTKLNKNCVELCFKIDPNQQNEVAKLNQNLPFWELCLKRKILSI